MQEHDSAICDALTSPLGHNGKKSKAKEDKAIRTKERQRLRPARTTRGRSKEIPRDTSENEKKEGMKAKTSTEATEERRERGGYRPSCIQTHKQRDREETEQ